MSNPKISNQSMEVECHVQPVSVQTLINVLKVATAAVETKVVSAKFLTLSGMKTCISQQKQKLTGHTLC